MKKTIAVLGIALLILALAAPASARGWGWGRGGGDCWQQGNRGYGYPSQPQGQFSESDRKHFDEMNDLRNQLWTKSRELDAVLSGPDPDVEKARSLQKELSELRAEMDDKRLEYGLENRRSLGDDPYARGYGRGYGPGMRGYGRGMGYGPGYGMGGSWY